MPNWPILVWHAVASRWKCLCCIRPRQAFYQFTDPGEIELPSCRSKLPWLGNLSRKSAIGCTRQPAPRELLSNKCLLSVAIARFQSHNFIIFSPLIFYSRLPTMAFFLQHILVGIFLRLRQRLLKRADNDERLLFVRPCSVCSETSKYKMHNTMMRKECYPCLKGYNMLILMAIAYFCGLR